MRTLLGKSLQDYRRTKRIPLRDMAKTLSTTPAILSAIEWKLQPEPPGFHHKILAAYPDFLTTD